MDEDSCGPRPFPDWRREDAWSLDRRRFLMLAAGIAAVEAIRPLEAWARRAEPGVALQPWSVPREMPGSTLDTVRALIGAGVLAPSDWNAQPWRFEVEGPQIRIVADPARTLPVTDPDRRGMMLGLGAALENMLVTARAYGLRPVVMYLPNEGANGVMAELTWTLGDQQRDRGLFSSIIERRTNRHDYDGRAIFTQNRVQLSAQVPDGIGLHWIDDRDRMRRVADLTHEATHAQMSDTRAQAEQYSWLRFDGEEKKRGDGVPVDALEFAGPAQWFASRYFNPKSMFLGFGMDSSAKQARSQVRSSGALALLTASRKDEGTRLMAGQTFERLALRATSLGIAHHAMSAPIEVEKYRAPLLAEFGATGEDPLLLIRLGHAKPPKPSPRRAVSLVATYRNT
jgi:hypothetical protein